MQKKWTQEEIDFAIQCLKNGMSAGATAKSMSEAGIRAELGPISRNAIIGIWNRNAKSIASTVGANKGNINLKNKNRFRDISKNKASIPRHVSPENGLYFDDLTAGVCRFPFGDPDVEPIRYCGQAIDYSKGASYCTRHYTLCYYPPRKK